MITGIEVSQGFPIVWAGDHGFEEARVGRVFNHRRPSRYPLAVVQAHSVEEVIEAVHIAKKLGCKISVRSGGHSWAAWSVRDNAILLDLGKMNSMDLEESTGIVSVGPATTGTELNKFLEPKGRIFNGGHCPNVGLGGFLLQGGMGWICRGWGWSAESVVGIDVVTAAGQRTYCSETVHSDLFWSARGSGPGFFAVVTRFYLKTREQPAGMFASTYVWDISEYDAVMPWLIDTARIADPLIEIVAVGLYKDNTENAPPDQRPQFVVRLLACHADILSAKRSLELFASTVPRRGAAIFVNEYEPTSFSEELVQQHKQNPESHRYCVDNAWISNLPTEELVSSMRDAFLGLPTIQSFALYYNMAPVRELPDMALSLQTEHYLAVYSIWKHKKHDEDCQAWMRSIFRNIEHVSPGVYLGDSDFQVRQAAFLAPGKREMLENHRKKWDPDERLCSYLGLDSE